MTKIGDNIRKHRELKNYTQEYMADMLGMNQSSYSKLESETYKITANHLLKISEVLEVDVSDLLNFPNQNVYHQTFQDVAYGNGHVENLHVENQKTLEKLIQAKDELLQAKDEQIALLKRMLEQKS